MRSGSDFCARQSSTRLIIKNRFGLYDFSSLLYQLNGYFNVLRIPFLKRISVRCLNVVVSIFYALTKVKD